MGCASSVYLVAPGKNSNNNSQKKKKNKKPCVPEIVIFVPPMRIPVQSDLRRPLKGLIPKDLAEKLHSLRNQIVLVSQDTGTISFDLFFLLMCL